MVQENHSPSFTHFAKLAAKTAGKSQTFFAAVLVIIIWAGTGPIFHYSDTWQLVINTGTTIITFLMVFLIQNTQNRDTTAIQLKLDEIIRSLEGAHNTMVDLEELSDAELERLHKTYAALAAQAKEQLEEGGVDTDKPDVVLYRG